MEVPALQNRPTLSRWVYDYWEAFRVLGSSRTATQAGLGPIPLSELVAYLDMMSIQDIDERLTYIKMIQSLDSVYVTHINDKAKASAAKQKAAPKPGVRGRR